MNESSAEFPAAPVENRERKIVCLIGLLAAIHVFIFSAALPFFGNVDEQVHLDLAVRYASLDVPRAMEMPCAEALPFIAVYGTIEYLWSPESQPGGRIAPPPWTLPIELISENLLEKQAIWKAKVKNHEASQPPVYYTLGGLWWQLGKLLGLDGGQLLYWLRFMNILVVVTLVWLGHLAARWIFPENLFVRLGVPALMAFFPQTAFYSIQNDVLSPVCFGAAFIFLVKFLGAETPGLRLGIFTGLLLAATFLTKISNLPLLAVSGLIILLKTVQLIRAGKIRPALPALAALAVCAGLPMLGWLMWCKINFGDYSGTAEKIQFLGWTHKTIAEWWQHPVFSPRGLWTFWSELIATFWQGELLWHRRPLALPWANLAYVSATMLLLGIALLKLFARRRAMATPQRLALWLSFGCFTAAVAFLGFLSIIYDYNDCFYPSRAHPYFTSGRLMLGALIPFLLLFTFGLDQVLKRFSQPAKFTVLSALLLFMLAMEIATHWQIFPNPYNWFHM